MKYICSMLLILTCGCMHTVEINATKSWEGHYYDVESFKKAVENVQLDKNETIWVLSDRTLNRVLKNTER